MGQGVTVSSGVPDSRAPAVYDFRRPMTLSREHARLLEMAFGTFSRQWANQLVARLRVPVQATFERVVMCSYDEYITSLPARTTMVVCSVEPGRRPAVVEFPIDAALTWIDHMLGGRGVPGAVPERDLTEIEQQLIRDLMGRVLADLTYSFTGITTLDAEYRHLQYTPQFLQLTAAATAVIVATITISVGDHRITATVMLPGEGLIAAMREGEDLETRTVEEIQEEQYQKSLLDLAVQEVPVDVAVRFRPVPVHPRDVLGLAVGDVLPLNHPSSHPLDVVVGDRTLAQAAAGSSGSRLAGLVVNVKENS